jgi:polysaccharide biosynthesis protein PslH
MANLLYLVHRLPFPPDKGDKVRSYHLLRHLVERHRVFLGTFVDDADDERHLPEVRRLCAGVHAGRLHPRLARVASLGGLLTGEALTNRYYRDAALARWVDEVARRQSIDATIVFSSSMAQYAETVRAPLLTDFVDVDSAKWTQYADAHRWPLSWLYRREGRRLLAHECEVAERSDCSFFVTPRECRTFRELAPDCRGRVEALFNGVDARFFDVEPQRPSPFADGERSVVFTGAMDYWPNIDAVTWFAREVLPGLVARHPTLRFYIVGRSPAPAVRALAGESVRVTGTVADVRPYLQHADAVVAPLRLARGLQNKILEAMAMQQPVVTSPACAEAIMGDSAVSGNGLFAAPDADAYQVAVDRLLRDRPSAREQGAAARAFALREFSWPARLAVLDEHLERVTQQPRVAA